MINPEHRKVERRNLTFTERPATKIWLEEPSAENPYIAESCYCHGYDLLELMEKRNLVEIQYLLFRGQLPTPEQTELLSKLQIAMISPGPRHPAVRAAMCAGIGKTDLANMLPLALNVLGGAYQGATEVKASLSFLLESASQPAISVAATISTTTSGVKTDISPFPGFGSRFGSRDIFAEKLAEKLVGLPAAGKHLAWGAQFANQLKANNMGWYRTGVAAAALADLGFQPLEAVGIYQMICAPGIIAHGLEMQEEPLTAMPFPSDDKYIIEEE